MDNLASLTAQPRIITIDGRDYAIHPLTLDDFGKLQGWIDRQFPDPLEVADAAIKKGLYNVTQQQHLMKLAMEQALKPKHLIGSDPEADRLLLSSEGVKQQLVLSISKGDPGFTEADADALFAKLSPFDLIRVFSATGADLVIDDPKGEPPVKNGTTNLPGDTMSRRQRRAQKARGKAGGPSSIPS
jgi:hypothetical protein